MFHPTVWLSFLDNASVSIVFNFLLFLLWWWVLLYYTHLNTQVIFYILFYDWQVHLTIANSLVSCSVQKPNDLSTAWIGSYLLIQHLNWNKTSLVDWFELIYSLAMTCCWIVMYIYNLFWKETCNAFFESSQKNKSYKATKLCCLTFGTVLGACLCCLFWQLSSFWTELIKWQKVGQLWDKVVRYNCFSLRIVGWHLSKHLDILRRQVRTTNFWG